MGKQKSKQKYNYPIVLFDGVCSLCNQTVDTLIKIDKNRVLRYASLQSEAGTRLCQSFGYEATSLQSVVFINNGNIYYKSTAVLNILKAIGSWYYLAYMFIIFPQSVRDWVYDVIARNRYAWFGKEETCRLPNAQEKLLFLS